MAISFACPCGRTLRAKDELAGRRTKCPACETILTIPTPGPLPLEPDPPAATTLTPSKSFDDDMAEFLNSAPSAPKAKPSYEDDDDGGAYNLAPDAFSNALKPGSAAPGSWNPPAKTFASPSGSTFSPNRATSASFDDERPRSRPAASSSTQVERPSTIREYAYALFLLTLIPLAFSLLGKDDSHFLERLESTMEHATPEQARQLENVLNRGEQATTDELFAALPEGRLDGAHLSHETRAHWLYAGLAIAGFLTLILLFFSVERANPLHLLGVGLFTGTIGIVLLFVVQFCSQIRLTGLRGRGVVMIIVLILVFVGWSYRSALDGDSNFLLSAVGFTFGVGLCEELTKALPLLFYFKTQENMGWRGACLWGLASGIGFGVSEGIMYSADTYNGISGVDAYVVRFISCVALHAMWSASVGITIARTVGDYDGIEDGFGFGLYILRVLAVPMLLHGLYDTLLKMDMNLWALVTALASFGWFVLQVERARSAMPHAGLTPSKRMRYA